MLSSLHIENIAVIESVDIQFMGPVSGHDITRLIYMLRRAKEMHCPVLLHVLTQKGKGYLPAEQNPDVFHGVGRFDPETGEVQKGGPTFCDAFGEELVRLAAHDRRICAVTAAMRQGNSLDAFAETYPDRFFDVGIAEGHAVSMAGGLAKQGLIPVVAIYSTFLQRAFDMMMQDVALLHLHVVFAVDRAGLVGPDGETHHGEFDVGYLRQIPLGVIAAGGTEQQLDAAAQYAAGLGLAFQIRDDMLDVIGDAEKLGKKTGMDEHKNTYARLLSLDECRRRIDTLTEHAVKALDAFDDTAF